MRSSSRPKQPVLIPTRARGRLWPIIIVSLIGLNVSVVAGTIYLSCADSSFAVEPDAYLEATGWDQHVRKLEQSERLGWRCDVELRAPGNGSKRLALSVASPDGQPVSEADVTIEIFHRAFPRKRYTLTLAPDGDGTYAIDLPTFPSGTLEYSVSIRRGQESYTSTRTLTNPPLTAAQRSSP